MQYSCISHIHSPTSEDRRISYSGSDKLINSALDGLLERSAEFVRRQAEILACVTRMAEALTLNEGRQKDRAMLAATLQVFSRECEAEVTTYMRSLAAVSAMYRSARTGNDGMAHSGLFRTFPSIH
jgi:hypothetical protein